ncbi:MAG: hypothetical protein J3K34DRAFT_87789 [Monoraphidium minutum]|nr:MAG: hypothetical protein J3K34DRAFT_87789 [Monoraphidium minutum]
MACLRPKIADAEPEMHDDSTADLDASASPPAHGIPEGRGLPPLDELVAAMEEARRTADRYMEQAVFRRLLRSGGGQTFEERAAEIEGVKDRLAGVRALGHFATTLGRAPGAAAGGGARTRMLLRGEEVEVLNAGCLSYLGIERHPEVIAASKAALDDYGTSVTNSRAVCGSCPIHTQVRRSP